MTREDKRVQLKTIDDVEQPTPVIRLANRETVWNEKEEKAIRLGVPDAGAGVSQRLNLPTKEEIELRTHQPTIDELIDPGTISPELLEKTGAKPPSAAIPSLGAGSPSSAWQSSAP